MKWKEIFKKWHFWLLVILHFSYFVFTEPKQLYSLSETMGTFLGCLILYIFIYSIGVFVIYMANKDKDKK